MGTFEISTSMGGNRSLTQLGPEPKHLAQDLQDHTRAGQGALAAAAREVVHPDLDDAGARTPRPDQQLGVDETALALEREALEQRAPEQLEGEVDVLDPQSEEKPHDPRVEER